MAAMVATATTEAVAAGCNGGVTDAGGWRAWGGAAPPARPLAMVMLEVQLVPAMLAAAAGGRRAGALLASPMAEGLESVREGRRGLERKGLAHVFIVAKGQLTKHTPSLGRTYGR